MYFVRDVGCSRLLFFVMLFTVTFNDFRCHCAMKYKITTNQRGWRLLQLPELANLYTGLKKRLLIMYSDNKNSLQNHYS
jgi:hypothetical protein